MLIDRIKKTKAYTDISSARQLLHSLDMKLRQMALPCLLTFIASLFDGLSFGLLIPAIDGFFRGNLTSVTKLPVLGKLIGYGITVLGNRQSVILGLLVAMVFSAVILKNVFSYASSLTASYLSLKLASNLRKKVYARYLSFGKLFFDRTSAGYLYQVLLGFTGTAAGQLGLLQSILQNVLSLALYIIIMFAISWRLTLIVLLTFPVFHYSVSWLIQKIKKSSDYLMESSVAISRNISNTLSVIPLIKSYQSEEKEKSWFDRASDQLRGIMFSMDKKQSLIPSLQEMISASMLIILIAAMAFLLVGAKAGNIGGYMVFLLLIRRVAVNFGSFGSIRGSFAGLRGPLQEVSRVFDDNDKFFVRCGSKEFSGLKENITFDNLAFSYPGGITALRDINLSIRKGLMTAVVGASGAGKTTLISLIMRFYDIPPGKIRIDGVDIRDFSLSSLMSRIALVSQDTFIVNDTLRANIAYGMAGNVSDEAIHQAAGLAQLSGFIANLPEGLNTNVGDRGVKLSGGEKQRVSITRAILRQAEIIILDEATSSLDSITESLIQKALAELVKNRTTIVIAHRLSTIKHADNIIVLDSGRVIENGPLDQLLEARGKFYRLWQEQKFF